jgi:mono/diheme cytochrome c family protein
MKLLLLIGLLLALAGTMTIAQTKPKPMVRPKPAPTVVKTPAVTDPGAAVFNQYCLVCHQTDGGGVPKMYPSLRGADWVTGDKSRLILVLLKGLKNVEIDGEAYDDAMPAHDYLTDRQIADVLTYVRANFTNKATPIQPEEVASVRK